MGKAKERRDAGIVAEQQAVLVESGAACAYRGCRAAPTLGTFEAA
jgi:hypothetical protein